MAESEVEIMARLDLAVSAQRRTTRRLRRLAVSQREVTKEMRIATQELRAYTERTRND